MDGFKKRLGALVEREGSDALLAERCYASKVLPASLFLILEAAVAVLTANAPLRF